MRLVLILHILCTAIHAQADFIDERAPAQPAAAAPVGSRAVRSMQAVAAPAAKPAAEAFLELRKGKPVFEALRAHGKETGWDLIWDAPVYVAERDIVVPGDFETALVAFLKGSNEAGTRMRATFYRGNKTVRITEF